MKLIKKEVYRLIEWIVYTVNDIKIYENIITELYIDSGNIWQPLRGSMGWMEAQEIGKSTPRKEAYYCLTSTVYEVERFTSNIRV